MQDSDFQVYRYRWIVLAVFMLAATMNQLLWITFAPITNQAAAFYGVSDLDIGMLSMSFMLVYVLVSIPASWVIDTYGIRVGVGTGAALTGVFGLLRGLTAHSYALVLVSQIGIAVGQPFILNAVTTVAARWFPPRERATASGLGSLSIYLGILLGLALTPSLTARHQMGGMLLIYGASALGAAALFFWLARERPPTPPCPPGMEARSLVLDGFKRIFRPRDFLLLLGVTWAQSYAMLLTSSLVLGFFLLSAGPIGFQYGAEITYPIPEGTSNGMLLLVGQIAGILFIFAMDGLKSPVTGSMDGSLVGLIALLVLCLGLGALLKEPATLLTQAKDAAKARTVARSA
jgi:MFS family permease